jgi:phage-related protein (TIGR01555 family)
VPKAVVKRTQKPARRAAALDTFVNTLARMGLGMPNVQNAVGYPITRLTQDYVTLVSMYRNNWIVRKIVDVPAEDMTKAWINITSEMTPEMQDSIDRLERKTNVRAKITEGLKWGRLFGGGAALVMIDGMDENALMEPLNLDSIMPGSFRGLMVLDRWAGVYPDIEFVDDIADPEFGKPKYYEITDFTKTKSFMVHHSHLLRFEGRKLPMWEELSTQMWGESEIEIVFDELVKRDNASANLAGLIFRANLNIRKIKDLDALVGAGDSDVIADLYNTLEMQNQLMNNFSTYAVDADGDFQTIQNTTFTGINDVYESFMLDVCGASEMPMTKLFGRSPAGLSATGEGDLQNYYDGIDQKQESYLRPVFNKLLPVMFMSEFGYVPEDINFRFNSPRTPSEQDIADLVDKKAQTVISAYNAGLITQKIGMKELQEMGKTTGVFTNITDEDIELADNVPDIGDVPGFEMSKAPSDNLFIGDAWDESKHQRKNNGQFGSGGGNNSEKTLTNNGNSSTLKSSQKSKGGFPGRGAKGKDIARFLEKNNFKKVSHEGSHAKYIGQNGEKVTVVLNSKGLPPGTLDAIKKQSGFK